MTPRRIQRQRTRGWRMPEGAIYVGRPTKWGNPFRVTTGGPTYGTVYGPGWLDGHPNCAYISAGGIAPAIRQHLQADACRLYRQAIEQHTSWMPITIDDIRHELAGHDLACWCRPDWPCHADVLLELANQDGDHR